MALAQGAAAGDAVVVGAHARGVRHGLPTVVFVRHHVPSSDEGAGRRKTRSSPYGAGHLFRFPEPGFRVIRARERRDQPHTGDEFVAYGIGIAQVVLQAPGEGEQDGVGLPRGVRHVGRGTFTGDALNTPHGPVQVRITISEGRLAAVTAVRVPDANPRDREIAAYAVARLTGEALDAQSALDRTGGGGRPVLSRAVVRGKLPYNRPRAADLEAALSSLRAL
ncbi:hypothetical protein ACWEG1_23155 [Streptomyces bauhiniae]